MYDRRSYTGYIFMLNDGPISWESRKQRTVALSTMEAEYMALTEATKEALHLTGFLNTIGVFNQKHVPIFNDNLSAIELAKNPVFHGRLKHIDIKHHFVRDELKNGTVKIYHKASKGLIADVLTKGLPAQNHNKCISFLKIVSGD